MNTIEIDVALKTNIYTKKYFIGVFPIDKIPKKIKKTPSLLVINTDESTKPGTHWQAIFIPKSGCIEFFDTYGRLPNSKYLMKFFKENSNCIRLSYKQQLQSFFSKVCGQYCCLYLLHRIKKKSFKSFLNQFNSTSFIKNDLKAIKNFHTNFKTTKSIIIQRKHRLQSCCTFADAR
jgi:hypothetical protein